MPAESLSCEAKVTGYWRLKGNAPLASILCNVPYSARGQQASVCLLAFIFLEEVGGRR